MICELRMSKSDKTNVLPVCKQILLPGEQGFEDTSMQAALDANKRMKSDISAFIHELQNIMRYVIINRDLNNEDKVLIIDQLKAYLPAGLTADKGNIRLPVMIRGNWEYKHYNISRVSLGPKWLPDFDHAFVYQLTAKGVSSELIFTPTMPVGFRGSWLTRFADFFPFASIGWPLTRRSKELEGWINEQDDIKAIGTSLGGALALAHCKSEKFSKIALFNPALPWGHPNVQCRDVEVVIDSDDPLRFVGGVVPKQAKVQIIEPKQVKSSSKLVRKLLAHVRIGLLAVENRILKKGSEFNQSNRSALKFLIYWLIRPIFFIPICLTFVITCALHMLSDGVKLAANKAQPATSSFFRAVSPRAQKIPNDPVKSPQIHLRPLVL